MEQYFTEYTNWECWQNGMYRDANKEEYNEMVLSAIECLRNPENAMLSVVCEWDNSTRENLTDRKSNRKSWIGQAACCYQSGCNERATRQAWSMLTKEERDNANTIANKVIELWERDYLENRC